MSQLVTNDSCIPFVFVQCKGIQEEEKDNSHRVTFLK